MAARLLRRLPSFLRNPSPSRKRAPLCATVRADGAVGWLACVAVVQRRLHLERQRDLLADGVGRRHHDDHPLSQYRRGWPSRRPESWSSLSVRRGPRACHRKDEVDLETDELGRQTRKPLDLAVCSSGFNDEVLPFYVASVPQPLPDGIERQRHLGRSNRTRHQETYSCDLRRLLRRGGARRGERAGQRARGSGGAPCRDRRPEVRQGQAVRRVM